MHEIHIHEQMHAYPHVHLNAHTHIHIYTYINIPIHIKNDKNLLLLKQNSYIEMNYN